MKKKVYIAPEMETVTADVSQILASSVRSNDWLIDYGGVDENGEEEPE